MTEVSLPWGGISVGDCGPYTDDMWSDMYRVLFDNSRQYIGVIVGYLNELAITNPVGTTIRVASGAALVDGKFYTSSANVDLSAGGGDGYYIVVLRKDFVAQTVRLDIVGPSVLLPTPTQTDPILWEVVIASVSVVAGTPTITDNRRFVRFSSDYLPYRQGDNTAGLGGWTTPGTDDIRLNPATTLEQVGAAEFTMLAGQKDASVTVTFPLSYLDTGVDKPMVFVTLDANENLGLGAVFTDAMPTVGANTGVQVTLYVHSITGAPGGSNWVGTIYWRAIGYRR